MAQGCLARFWFCLTWMLIVNSVASAQGLIDGAKKEGQVVFYASMEVPSAQRLTAAFESRHPYIKVEATRIGSERMTTRLIAEAQVTQGPRRRRASVGIRFLWRLTEGALRQLFSPERAAFPAEYRDEKGLWMMARRDAQCDRL